MAKQKIREITINESGGTFAILKKPKIAKSDYDFKGLLSLRQLLNNEKARILHTIKVAKPSSIYALAKKLDRNFKAVFDDIKLLERFGFIELLEEKTKNRTRHRPVVIVDSLIIQFNV